MSLEAQYLLSAVGMNGMVNKTMNESLGCSKSSESNETCEESITSDDSESESESDSDSDDESFDSDDDDDYSLNSDIDIEAEEEAQEKPIVCQIKEASDKKSGLFLSLEMVKMLRISTSCDNFNKLVEDETIQKMIPATRCSSVSHVPKYESKIVYAHQTASSMVAIPNGSNDNKAVPKPKDVLFQLLKENDVPCETKSYETIMDEFIVGDIEGYSLALMKAVKNGDVDYLRSIIGTQKTFQCCNRFGESIAHAAARQGNINVLKFLIEEANVSMRVVCDTGRNPLHDSCWTAKPNFECVEYMIQRYPEYLLIADKRGYTPLEYAPIDSHGLWSQFLNDKKDLLISLLREKDGYPILI